MAGHSKWANIKHRKGKADAIKGKIFSRITKEIITAVKLEGSDPKTNARLRLVLQKAKAANMPYVNIERNIKKASSSPQEEYSEITYEIYGYGGVGILLEIMTDNKNRISSEIRIVLNKKGGTQANPGAVSYNFEQKGVIQILKRYALEESLFLITADAGAEDFEIEDDSFIIVTPPQLLFQVKEALDKASIPCEIVELQMIPKTFVECDLEDEKANSALFEALEHIEDVSALYHNMKLSS